MLTPGDTPLLVARQENLQKAEDARLGGELGTAEQRIYLVALHQSVLRRHDGSIHHRPMEMRPYVAPTLHLSTPYLGDQSLLDYLDRTVIAPLALLHRLLHVTERSLARRHLRRQKKRHPQLRLVLACHEIVKVSLHSAVASTSSQTPQAQTGIPTP